ncbi:esterase [Bacillus glycinifermentans]|uniref:alpha/beta hydrolase family protein n=1 Tax=Bacillus glycinifermentans TaxID=1664069 RepID=UPI000653521A|nr:alpha/beta hydrolase [Bacillus glycinifermentans]KMM62531.1 esterase [Bacillus glycinifermentans]MEC0494853.1 alpha/beta hydrolase [Bacillus glycinifermentans]MEC0541003.1 alpha/beta hydrolase [Bacillus glycinifermentans]
MSNKVNISYGQHRSQYGVLRLPERKEPCPVVVTIHGGFWQSRYDLEENNPIAEDLTNRGYATWNIEYRRVGEEGGGWTGTFNDVIDAINHLLQLKEPYRLDLSNIMIVGHSAGGHLALWLASRTEIKSDQTFNELAVSIKKVISLAGVTDLKKMWEFHKEKGMKSHVSALLGGSPHEVAERYKIVSPIELLPMKIDHVLIHGVLDRHVPVELSKNYYLKAIEMGSDISLVVLPDVEHFKIIDPTSTAWDAVIDTIF